MKFYLVFGVDHPLRDGWVEIEALSYAGARLRIFEVFGTKWACVYLESEFNSKYFPAGKFGNTLKV